jgi:O-antigen ligase
MQLVDRVRQIENLDQRIMESLLIGIIVSLPFSIKLTNGFIIFSLVWAGKVYLFNKGKRRVGLSLWYWLSILPFAFCLLTLIYTHDLNSGLYSIDKYLPLIALPTIFYLCDVKPRRSILLSFAYVITVLCLVAIAWNIVEFIMAPGEVSYVGDYYNRIQSAWNNFTHINLVRLFSINPIYLSCYLLFCIVIILESYSDGIKKYVWLLVLFVFLMLLSSRTNIFLLVFSLLSLGLIKRSRMIIVLLLSFFIVGAALLYFNPVLKARTFGDLSKYSSPADISGWNAVNIRLSIWGCSWEAIRSNPLWGYGAGSQLYAVEDCYRRNSWYGPFGTSFNSHNQFIEYTLIGGVVLLGCYMVQLGYSLYQAWNWRSNLHMVFLLQFMFINLTESMLETHKGIVYFAFFNALYLSDYDFTAKSETSKL